MVDVVVSIFTMVVAAVFPGPLHGFRGTEPPYDHPQVVVLLLLRGELRNTLTPSPPRGLEL
jgi:hypothetical protein